MNDEIFNRNYIDSNQEDSKQGLAIRSMLSSKANSKIYVLHNKSDRALLGSQAIKGGKGKGLIVSTFSRD